MKEIKWRELCTNVLLGWLSLKDSFQKLSHKNMLISAKMLLLFRFEEMVVTKKIYIKMGDGEVRTAV